MTTPTRRPKEETARLGEEIYERDIRPHVEPDRVGEFAAIDVDSGDYALADTTRAAADILREKRPDAHIWMVRVGYRTAQSFGGRLQRRA